MKVFVTVGNALVPFDRLLAMVDGTLPEGATGWCQHGVSSLRPRNLVPIESLSRTAFEATLSEADVVVCHAGVGTLWSAIRAGHTPIVVPRRRAYGEIVNDHQLEICEVLRKRQQIQFVADADGMSRALRAPIVRGPRRLNEAAGLALIDAAVSDAAHVKAPRHPRLLKLLSMGAPPLARLRRT